MAEKAETIKRAREVAEGIAEPGAAVEERMAAGRALRERAPRRSHGDWAPSPDRPDPIDLLESQSASRVPELVPIRYGRMSTSPFAFYRGAALVMADDLSHTPRSGITVQVCGDAHLSNLGVFATPERNIVFDLNDFDETLPGPWEWDVKRLVASFVVAGRHRGFASTICRGAAMAAVRAYQLRMREFAEMRLLDVWYARIDTDMILASLAGTARVRTERNLERARLRDHLQAQSKLTEVVDGERRFIDQGPLLRRVGTDELNAEIARAALEDYAKTLQQDRRELLSRYRTVDIAMKVVGVGSVGTRCLILLMQGRDDADPLILQVKEATSSVLERYLKKSPYRNHGQRVVEGQRLMQAASDMFLGWIQGRGDLRLHFYWRQLRDAKGSVDLEAIRPEGLTAYATLCGVALARAHARSGGQAAEIAGYIGTGGVFAEAITAFAEAYADQTERDYARLVEAIGSGKVQAIEGM
jgi:uncharacterized protein (DUF2252 family)